WLAAVCFYENYVPAPSRYVSHFWSLAMEEHFYLLFPLMLALLGNRRMLWTAIALAVAMILWRFIDAGLKLTEPTLSPPWFRTDSACDGLLWGCAAALIFHRPKCAAALQRSLTTPVLIASLAALVGLMLFWSTRVQMLIAAGTMKSLIVPIILL